MRVCLFLRFFFLGFRQMEAYTFGRIQSCAFLQILEHQDAQMCLDNSSMIPATTSGKISLPSSIGALQGKHRAKQVSDFFICLVNQLAFIGLKLFKIANEGLRMDSNSIFNMLGKFQILIKFGTSDALFIAEILLKHTRQTPNHFQKQYCLRALGYQSLEMLKIPCVAFERA